MRAAGRSRHIASRSTRRVSSALLLVFGCAEPVSNTGLRRCRSRTSKTVSKSLRVCVLTLGVAVCLPGSAVAAPPETPVAIAPCSACVTATEAPIEGILNPGKEGEAGTFEMDTYNFVYRQSSTECEGAGELTTEPTLSLGAGSEFVAQRLTGLTAGTTYAVCLVVGNMAKESSSSLAVSFKTAVPPEVPETRPATDITSTGATFHAILDPNAPAEGIKYKFFYEAASTECNGAHSKAIPETAVAATGAQGEAVEQSVTGLLPTTTYTYCIFVRNEAFEQAVGSPVTFTTPPGIPAVTEQTASSIGVTSAEVSALIAPGGLSTAYHVEYVTQAQYEAGGWTAALRIPAKDADLPASLTPIAVREQLAGLAPDTQYRFRYVASNEAGTSPTGDATFTTRNQSAVNAGTLPDSRGYELISGATSGNTYVLPGPDSTNTGGEVSASTYPMRSSEDGNSVTYVGDPSETDGNGLTGARLGNQFLARRDPSAHDWSNTAITPQAAAPQEAEQGSEYQGFSEDLSRGVVGVAASHFASSAEPHGPFACGALYSNAFEGSFRPLFTETLNPGFCGVLPIAGEESPAQALLFAGGNRGTATVPAYSRLLFQTPAALTPGTERSVEGEGDNLYVSVETRPRLVSVLPDGTSDANAVFGSPPAEPSHRFDFSGVISADGSSVFWTDLTTNRVFLRKNPTQAESPRGGAGECLIASDACTVAVSAGEATFWTATPDGHYAFYTEGGQLWRYNTELGSREALLQIGEHGEGAGVQGVIGVSESGGNVYLVASGQLSPDSEGRKCEEPKEEEEGATAEEQVALQKEQEAENEGLLPTGRGCNLYLLRVGHGTSYIRALAARDDKLALGLGGATIRLGTWQSDMGVRTAEVTPNGLGLVFASTQRLLGYDTASLVRKEPGEKAVPEPGLEIFVYNAGRESGGTLSCASCEPRGQPTPHGAIAYMAVSLNSTYAPRWTSDDGQRVFFNTNAPLVPEDTNGKLDVYEWENGGADCPSASSNYGGCIFLLSGGSSQYRSYLIDASATGDDVFFTHRGQLGGVGLTTSNNVLFDARVGGGFAEVSEGCSAGSCGGSASSGSGLPASPPSLTAGSGGNIEPTLLSKPKPLTPAQIRALRLKQALKACHTRHNKSKRKRCERSARKRFGAHTRGASKAHRARAAAPARRTK